jgi:hypothetical protein
MYEKELALAWAKVQNGLKQEDSGRQLWLEGTIELIQILDKARQEYISNQEFGRWLKEKGPPITYHERWGLLNMALNIEFSLEILKTTHRRSYQKIWYEEIQPRLPTHRQTPVTENQLTEEEPVEIKPTRYPKKKKTKAEQIREYNEATGFKLLGYSVTKAKPIGRMPDDIRDQFDKELDHMFKRLKNLEQLGRYSDQMAEDLRHYLAGRMNYAKIRIERMAKEILGGDGDLRKIRKPACGDDFPIRLDDEASSSTLQ